MPSCVTLSYDAKLVLKGVPKGRALRWQRFSNDIWHVEGMKKDLTQG